MRTTTLLSLGLAIASYFCVAAPARAATGLFLRATDIPGESVSKGHTNDIEVLSWSWGAARATSTSGGGTSTGSTKANDFVVRKRIDKSTPLLMRACATGQVIDEVILTAERIDATGKPSPYLTITMMDVVVTKFDAAGAAEEPAFTDSFSFNFEEIKFEYFPPGSKSPVSFTWKITQAQ